MAVTHARRIGQDVFLIEGDGVIIRTVVSALKRNGGYELLKSSHHRGYFSFEETLATAEHAIRIRLDSDHITRHQAQALEERLAAFPTEAFREEVMSQTLIQSSQFNIVPEKNLGADTEFPKDYFLPSQIVYCLITPATHNGRSPAWRPRPYFILKTRVEEVSFAAAHIKSLRYSFTDTHYHVAADKIFATEKEARNAMVPLFALETNGTIDAKNVPVHPAKEETAFREKFLKRLVAESRI